MGIVYSTDHGRMCPDCGMPIADCVCRRTDPVRKGNGIVRLGRETKGRKGKGVTLIAGLSLPDDELLRLASDLKRRCGSGGTVRDGVIEIQGDHRDILLEELRRRGHTVKCSGG